MNNYQRTKKRTKEILGTTPKGDLISMLIDIFLIALILINVIIVILETFELPQEITKVTNIIETISVVIFTIEYVLRLWIAEKRIKYIFSLAAIIDLLAILPFYLPFVSANLVVLRVFRIFRILRLFKLDRYVSALHTIFNVFRCKAHQLISSMIVVVLLMIVASVLIYNVEHDYQPEVFENALSGLWWAFATLTTVGYGDIYPVTVFGKVLSAVIALLGIGFVAVPTGIITSGFSEEISKNKTITTFDESKQDENTISKEANINLNNPLEIHAIGMKALQDALGSIGTVRFLQQFDPGNGDYTKEKQNAQDLSLEEIEALLKSSK